MYFSQGSIELIFPSYEVCLLIATQLFADSPSLVDESSNRVTIKASASIKFNVSRCIAREQRQLKISPLCLSSYLLSLMSHSALLELVGNKEEHSVIIL